MDEVFGSQNAVSTITFKKTTGAGSFAGGTDVLASVCDFLIWYAKDLNQAKYKTLFRTKAPGGAGGGQYTWVETESGERRRLAGHQPRSRRTIDAN